MSASALLLVSACAWDYEPTNNILPEVSASSDSSEPPPDLPVGDAPFPATYRLDCAQIQELGDAAPDAFQWITLQNTWNDDIKNFKLSILVDLVEEDETSGMGTVQIRSGVGSGWNEQCSEPTTESALADVSFDREMSLYVPADADDVCSEAAPDGAVTNGTYYLEMGPDDFVYIYTEDNDGTPFNCDLGGGPNALPVSGVTATLTMSEDRAFLAGTLNGCMALSSANNVCSCLAVCDGDVHPDCPGCPGGALPLGALLTGVNPTSHCTELVGEDAFDITLGFTARRLAEVPESCP